MQPTVLLTDGMVEPNEQHPLFEVDSERRPRQRQTVIGAILARLARAGESDQGSIVTIR